MRRFDFLLDVSLNVLCQLALGHLVLDRVTAGPSGGGSRFSYCHFEFSVLAVWFAFVYIIQEAGALPFLATFPFLRLISLLPLVFRADDDLLDLGLLRRP